MAAKQVLAGLRSSWWLPVVCAVLAGGLALGASLMQTPMYTATTQLFVSATDQTSTTAAYQGSQFSEQRVASYAELISGEDLASRVIRRLGLNMSAVNLSREVSASAVPNTVLIDVSVTDSSPSRSQSIAEAVGAEFTRYAADLEATGASGSSPVKVTVTQHAMIPSKASSPKLWENVALGVVAGIVIGLIAIVLRVRLDRSVSSPLDAEDLSRAPVIGTVLKDPVLGQRHTFDRGISAGTAENYRQLRTNLQFLNVDEPPRVIMVSSAIPSEGKTTLVVNLSIALAEAGRTVTVVEADLRRPKVTRYLGLVGDVGLTNVLAGTAGLDDVVQDYRENMSVIAAGPNPPNPGELLASSQMASLIDKLRGQRDFVLIDAPPLLPVADSSGLAVHVDGVLLSVKYGSTRKDQLREAAATLERVGATTLGVVLNIVPPKAEVATAYGYGYDYGYAEPKHAK